MEWMVGSLLLAVVTGMPADMAPIVQGPGHEVLITPTEIDDCAVCNECEMSCTMGRRFLESDHAFDGFIGPISNPILSKDPRSLTEARFLYVHNNTPGGHAVFPSTDINIYALQVRLALTERLTFIADKDGYGTINLPGGAQNDGWLNIAAGLKYTLIRDVENQQLFTVGAMWELQSGEAEVLQNQGDGIGYLFWTYGKEFGCKNHLLWTSGFAIPADSEENSTMYYSSVHLDRELFKGFYPLVEINTFSYLDGGDRGLPKAVGEGDGLINIGTSDMDGETFATVAIGAKQKIGDSIEAGLVWEKPMSKDLNIMEDRLTFELIFRY